MSDFNWDQMAFWETGEWQVVQENLEDLQRKKVPFNPDRENLFAALDATPFDKCKVMWCGQDPYPSSLYATGLAFSIPKMIKTFPVTLQIIFEEYQKDLGLPSPRCGDLSPWADQGILLWNVIPSCLAGKSLSHDWIEWRYLTNEIIEKLAAKGIVFVFSGNVAQEFYHLVKNATNCRVIKTSHPSPRGVQFGKNPFIGSRIFSTINSKLNELKLGSIEWRL